MVLLECYYDHHSLVLFRLYDIVHSNCQPIDLEASASKNVTAVGFDRDTKMMFAGGEDNTARIWDLRDKPLTCQRIFQVT